MSDLSITIEELRRFKACDLNNRVEALSSHLGRTPTDDEPIPLLIWAEVTPSNLDLLWALRCCWGRGGRDVGVEVACRAAERVAHLAGPREAACREAIAAARRYMVTLEDLRMSREVAADAAGAAARRYTAILEDLRMSREVTADAADAADAVDTAACVVNAAYTAMYVTYAATWATWAMGAAAAASREVLSATYAVLLVHGMTMGESMAAEDARIRDDILGLLRS